MKKVNNAQEELLSSTYTSVFGHCDGRNLIQHSNKMLGNNIVVTGVKHPTYPNASKTGKWQSAEIFQAALRWRCRATMLMTALEVVKVTRVETMKPYDSPDSLVQVLVRLRQDE
jgi:hypothetical protein